MKNLIDKAIYYLLAAISLLTLAGFGLLMLLLPFAFPTLCVIIILKLLGVF